LCWREKTQLEKMTDAFVTLAIPSLTYPSIIFFLSDRFWQYDQSATLKSHFLSLRRAKCVNALPLGRKRSLSNNMHKKPAWGCFFIQLASRVI
jgi:hypothetical protein